jgi:LPS export ABC transporter protein LptC
LEFSAISAYRGDNRLWELKAIKIIQTTIDNRILAAPVKLTIFGDSAKISAVLTADSGISNAKNDSLFVWGNVKIDAHSGERLLSPTLEWNTKEKLLLSNDIVEISTADGEIIRGRGFRAAENFEWWDFDNDVSGNFPSVQAEFEKE